MPGDSDCLYEPGLIILSTKKKYVYKQNQYLSHNCRMFTMKCSGGAFC